MAIHLESVLQFGSALQRATTLRELVEATLVSVRRHTRFDKAWFAIVDPDDPATLLVPQIIGDVPETPLGDSPRIPITGDAMLAELFEGRAPVIVREAAEDPRTNKEMVRLFGNRTIVNVPMLLGPTLVGSLGVGTFGDEGPLDVTREEIEHLVIISTLLAGAVARLHLVEQRRAADARRVQLEASIEAMQRVELMGVLAAGVAHDLNNYLGVVLGNLEMATIDASRSARAIEDARFAAEKASAVTAQLLALGKRREAAPSVLDLGGVVDGTLRLVRPAIPRAIELTVDHRSAVAVRAHAVQIEQAVANLVLNARDALGKSGRISVGVSEAEWSDDEAGGGTPGKPGRYGRVLVQDTGPGIGTDAMARIFDPLYSTKREGTGLGLAVVARVAEQHGGFVRCASTPGEGAAFSLYLPVER